MTLREKLIKDASTFCAEKGISLARLATIVVNNGKFFKALQADGDCTTQVYERFQVIFDDEQAWTEAKAEDSRRRAATRGK